MRQKVLCSKYDLFLGCIYLLSYGLILFNSGIYSDDLCFAWNSSANTKDFIAALNIFPAVLPWFFSCFFSLKHYVLLQRCIVLVCLLIPGFIVYRLGRELLDEFPAYVVAFFFLIFPVYFLRVEVSTIHYSVCACLFYLGAFVAAAGIKRRNFLAIVLACLLLFVSFITHSIIAFVPVLLLYLFFLAREYAFTLPRIALMLCPIAVTAAGYAVIQRAYYPQGDYHTISLDGINLAILHARSYYLSLVEPVNNAINVCFSQPILVLALFYPLYRGLACFACPFTLRPIRLYLFGVTAFSCGIIAYNLASMTVCELDLNSRHQLLVPLGASLILLATVYLVAEIFPDPTKAFLAATSFLLSCFIVYNAQSFLAYQIDYYKQLSLIDKFRHSKTIENNTTFVVQDCTQDFNAKLRAYRFYEYNGLLKAAFGDEIRYATLYEAGMKIAGFGKANLATSLNFAFYNMADYVQHDIQIFILISKGPGFTTSFFRIALLMYQNIFNKGRFNEAMDDFMYVATFPIQNDQAPVMLCGDIPSNYKHNINK